MSLYATCRCGVPEGQEGAHRTDCPLYGAESMNDIAATSDRLARRMGGRFVATVSTPQRQEYDGEAVREALERTLSDPQRLLWRDDVEGICPTPGVCWEYGDTARCGPCAIKQAEARGVVSDMSVPNLPEVYRLRRELSSRTLPDGEALANELDAFVLVRTNDPALAIEVGDRVRAALAHPAQATPSAVSGDAGEIPRVPTEAMCAMGDMHMQDCSHDAASVWEAMLSALPSHKGAGE